MPQSTDAMPAATSTVGTTDSWRSQMPPEPEPELEPEAEPLPLALPEPLPNADAEPEPEPEKLADEAVRSTGSGRLKPSGQSLSEMMTAASERNTTGVMSGPAIRLGYELYAPKIRHPIVVDAVKNPTPSATSCRRMAFWPKSIDEKTQQKTNRILPHVIPEIRDGRKPA